MARVAHTHRPEAKSLGPSSHPYSPNVLEGVFSEVRRYGVLRSSSRCLGMERASAPFLLRSPRCFSHPSSNHSAASLSSISSLPKASMCLYEALPSAPTTATSPWHALSRSSSPIRSSNSTVSPHSGSPRASRSLPWRRSSRRLRSERMNSCHTMPLTHPSASVYIIYGGNVRRSPPRLLVTPFPKGTRFVARIGGSETSWFLFA